MVPNAQTTTASSPPLSQEAPITCLVGKTPSPSASPSSQHLRQSPKIEQSSHPAPYSSAKDFQTLTTVGPIYNAVQNSMNYTQPAFSVSTIIRNQSQAAYAKMWKKKYLKYWYFAVSWDPGAKMLFRKIRKVDFCGAKTPLFIIFETVSTKNCFVYILILL